jgi:hypothetical protein
MDISPDIQDRDFAASLEPIASGQEEDFTRQLIRLTGALVIFLTVILMPAGNLGHFRFLLLLVHFFRTK